MKRIALALFGSCCLGLPQAYANDGQGSNLNVGGQADPICAFKAAPRQLSASNMSLSAAGINASQINVDELVDGNTALLKEASIQLELSGVCNQAHYVSLQTTYGGLAPQESTTVTNGTFLQHVNYRATVEWAGLTAELQTSATAGEKVSSGLIEGANDGLLNIGLFIDSTTNDMNVPVVEGTYSDALIVQIGQAL
jgi:hypothetical protein